YFYYVLRSCHIVFDSSTIEVGDRSMIIDPISLVFLTVAVAVMAGVIFFLARGYTHIAEKLHEQAHEKAQEIIEIANKQASEIIASSKTYETDSNQALKDKLVLLEKQQEEIF